MKVKKWFVFMGMTVVVVTLAVVMNVTIRSDRNKRSVQDDVCGKDSIVAYVNNKPVSESELQFWMQRHRSEVFRYYWGEFGVGHGPAFWDTPHGGETPRAMLRRLAMEDLIGHYVQLNLAFTHGAIDTDEFNEIMSKRQMVNAKRRKAAATGIVIYGPIEYNEDAYFEYVFSNAVIRLKRILKEKLLQEYYDKNGHTCDLKKGTPTKTEVTPHQRDYYVDKQYKQLVTRLCKEVKWRWDG